MPELLTINKNYVNIFKGYHFAKTFHFQILIFAVVTEYGKAS